MDTSPCLTPEAGGMVGIRRLEVPNALDYIKL